MAQQRGVYLGVGVRRYQHAAHEELPEAETDVVELHKLLAADYDGEPLLDPGETAVKTRLSEVKDQVASGGSLVLQWSGHGLPALSGLGRLRLVAADSGTDDWSGLPVADVIAGCARSGASQILAVIDTCFSEAGLVPAGDVAAALLAERPDDDRRWVGLLAAAAPNAGAYDGELGSVIRRLLQQGPTTPTLKLRWSRHNARISGHDLCDAVLKEWTEPEQRPAYQGRGDARFMFRNPLHDPLAPAQVVEHLLVAARGTASLEEQSAFTGRVAEVDAVVGWVGSGRPGVHVLTGLAGTGKSAILGRVVSLSVASEREKLLVEGRQVEHLDPGEGSVAAHVHARGLTADRMAQLIDEWLVRTAVEGEFGVLPPAFEGRRNAALLAGALQWRAENGPAGAAPVIVVDGLDEARDEAFTIADDLLLRVARFATVLVSTRELHRPSDGSSLVDLLAAGGPVLDLSAGPAADRGVSDLRSYVVRRLADHSSAMSAEAVADLVATRSEGAADRPFLLARLITDRLREAPIDTSAAGWQALVSTSIEAAFAADLARTIESEDGASSPRVPDLARRLLTTLTWAYGSGFPEREWLAVASALDPSPVTRDDLGWVLDRLGRYILQDGEDGVAVYRLAHASLAEYLRPPFQASVEQLFDPAAEPVSRALAALYESQLSAGVPATAAGYLWRYLWRHAADLGLPGLDLVRQLAALSRDLVPDVALAAIEVSSNLSFWGRKTEAVAPMEEAAALRRQRAVNDPRQLPDLAAALTDLGIRYNEVGRRHDAIATTEEAVTLCRQQAATNPVHRSNLATALNNLGAYYSDIGRAQDAIATVEEAVSLRRRLFRTDPASRPDLAGSLDNLGVFYSRLGRHQDGLTAIKEAVTLYRQQVTANPAYAADLANALNNLGVRYSQLGRHQDGLTAIQEAVTLYRQQVTANPAKQPDLAASLINLALNQGQMGRPGKAIAAAEEGVTLFREQANDNAAYRPKLAVALDAVGILHSQLGRLDEAIAAAEEAVTLFREQSAINPAYRAGLAGALNNLGTRYRQAGRRQDAINAFEEAVTLYQEQATANPAYQPNLAKALDNLWRSRAAVTRQRF